VTERRQRQELDEYIIRRRIDRELPASLCPVGHTATERTDARQVFMSGVTSDGNMLLIIRRTMRCCVCRIYREWPDKTQLRLQMR
jgi:hypothetical protein